MKRFSEQLKKKSQTIRLSTAEKRDVRERLIAYMEYHPLPATTVSIKKQATDTTPYRIISIPANYLRLGLGVMATLVLIVVPAVAEQAVPGDILYPVKVRVTEEIRGSLNISSYEKVAWETERLERRISEARLLAKEGRLTPEVEADVMAAVKVHTTAAEGEIATLMVTDAEGASLARMTFATMLDVQSAVLRAEQSPDSDNGLMNQSTSALAGALEEGSVVALGKGDTSPVSFERLMAQLELETTRAYELLSSITKTATPQERSAVERRLADIERKINKASLAHDGLPDSAVGSLRSAWHDTQKLITFMSDIDVRSSVTVESLVPVVLTYDERADAVRVQSESLRIKMLQIMEGIDVVDDEDILEKITVTLPEIETLLLSASSTEPASIDAVELALNNASEIISSILDLADFPVLTEEELLEIEAREVEINEEDSNEELDDSDTEGENASTSSTTVDVLL